MKFLLISSISFFLFFGCGNNNELQFSNIDNPALDNASLPRLFTDNEGTVFLSWVEQNQKMAELKYSSFTDDTWSEPYTVAADTGWFVNWADFPSIIAQNGNPVAVHWLDKIPGNAYSYNVAISRFNESWSEPFNPHNDETATEHGFVSMTPMSDSTFAAVWLDGRNTAGRSHHEYSDSEKAMTLRGAIINQSSEEIETSEIDNNVCDCCNTSIARLNNGLIAAYRNRTEDEIRDIYIAKYSDGAWSDPKAVADDNWEIAACPVNGPAIDADNNTVAVAWFTGANNKAQVKLGISSNAGETFSEPVIVNNNGALGRVDIDIKDDNIWVSWVSASGEDAEINVRAYDLTGEPLKSFTIPGFSKSRSSGFPQISQYQNGLVVAYTDISGEKPVVKTTVLR